MILEGTTMCRGNVGSTRSIGTLISIFSDTSTLLSPLIHPMNVSACIASMGSPIP